VRKSAADPAIRSAAISGCDKNRGASMDNYDLIIVGGGIGGSSLAIVMARAGRSVLVLEKTAVFEDHVRGEWIAPWGMTEVRRLGLLDLLIGAGGHYVFKHVSYDETIEPAQAEAATLPLEIFAPDVPGPLCIGHPHHCQSLISEAGRAGATVIRGVDVLAVSAGAAPSGTFTVDGEKREARGRLLVGADGRNSTVRETCAITLHADKPHHMFGGMLVEGASGWDPRKQVIGTEGDFAFLAFPQGDGRVRVYGSYSLDERARFAGPDGARRFLDSFSSTCSPDNRHLVAGHPAGPLRSYANNDAWTDIPFAQGAVLIGDAAGWNDPIIGQGLSITYRDVRIVSELLLASDAWSPALLAPYAEERRERLRRLRFVASLTSELDAEFNERARARRYDFFQRRAADQSLNSHAFAVMAGPETLPAEIFTPQYRAKVLGQ
jgi:2-polyprenyl-6-methoxyphenol hydroxylase-like FAD-dependent oxidoreductase